MNTSPWLVVSLCAAVTLALALWLCGRPDPVPTRPVVVADAPPAPVPFQPAAPASAPAVGFSSRVPMGPGITVVAGNGQLVGDAVSVAVPDAFGQIQYLPKTDPRAVRYEEAQRAEHERIVQDNGPQKVNLGAFTVRNSVTARQRSVSVDPKP